ncbi:MAG: hypothetical protein ABS79_01475 [Planctomycetes bacterium SCN 63-9]|nr:MAG: hypothetical protein ABS79_01475 [Planctomycetes bacterium SCN 63-9]
MHARRGIQKFLYKLWANKGKPGWDFGVFRKAVPSQAFSERPADICIGVVIHDGRQPTREPLREAVTDLI